MAVCFGEVLLRNIDESEELQRASRYNILLGTNRRLQYGARRRVIAGLPKTQRVVIRRFRDDRRMRRTMAYRLEEPRRVVEGLKLRKRAA